VTAPSLFGRWHIAPLVWSFLDAHPRVRAELVLTNRNLDLVEEGSVAATDTPRITGPLSMSPVPSWPSPL
jgi:DNA-binding transcriptional LysR family regulator